MKYKITSFKSEFGQIIVQFIKNGSNYGVPLAIDLPIENGMYPEGSDLDMFILGFVSDFGKNRDDLLSKGVINSQYIESLVITPTPVSTEINLSTKEYEDKIREDKKRNLLKMRYKILRHTDMFFLTDSTISNEEREKWRVYRQELRDITSKPDWVNKELPLPPYNTWYIKGVMEGTY